jgi:hypothetical protein
MTRAVVPHWRLDAPKGAVEFIAKVQKMENGLILNGVDEDLGEKFIWQ